MSQIRKKFLLVSALFSLSFFLLVGCGSSNSQSNFDPVSGKHPAGWLPDGHMAEAKAHVDSCAECHGADYAGGISRVACTNCHIGNQQSIHPTTWGPLGYILHADYVKTNGNSSCANASCHGAGLIGGIGAAGPSCTSCHMGGVASKHPPWGTPDYAMHGSYVKSNGTSGCANARCHGTTLTGVSGSGPSCTLCHIGGVMSVHPAAWNGDIVNKHRTYDDYNTCRNIVCHGNDFNGVYLSGPSCHLCH